MPPDTFAKDCGVKLDEPFFTERDGRMPALSDTERRAYEAAWRILREPVPPCLDWNSLACPGARASRQVDHVARIIREVMR